MLKAIAPVGEWHVVVDTDEIDLRIRPERVEVEEHVAAAVVRLVPEILRPVGGIADLRPDPEDRADIGEQIPIGLHGRIGAGSGSDRRQSRHLGADQERIDPARRRAEMGVVQHHAPQAPVAGCAGPADTLARDAEARGRRRAEQRGDLRGGRGGLVDGPGIASGRRTGDPSSPRECGLARVGGVVGIGVRQAVAGRHVHQDERIEGHPQPARLHLLDGLHHREVGRRAAIDRPILVIAADEEGIGAAHGVHRPAGGGSRLGRDLDTRAHLAGARAQIVAEPRHHEADALDRRGHGLKPVQRLHHVRGVCQRVQVLGHRRAAIGLADRLRCVGELARGRDHGDGPGQPLGRVGIRERAEHLE